MTGGGIRRANTVVMRRMKLGSLFDGSGGFPLAGALAGIELVWAAEIEPYPIAVTRSRFPMMQHLGSVTEVHGDKVQPVDVITFGSPCQDLSVVGKRAGIHDGQRSNLFFEAIRIIKEMRVATNGQHPTFAVWENVPGAFSSNGWDDFRCVLEALANVAGRGVSVPRPAGGKWLRAGEIVGDGYSVAWRQLDAQYWGVPQRRKRIYLVADFRGGRAGKILFESDGLRGNPAPGGTPGQVAAGDAAGSAGRSDDDERLIYALQGNGIDIAETDGCNGRGWREDVCYTLNCVCYDTTQITSPINYSNPKNGDPCHPLAAKQHPPLVVYAPTYGVDCRNAALDAEKTHALQAKASGGRSLNCTPCVLTSGRPQRKYIIRRLTPLECCRLQGFPDGWGVPDRKDRLSDEELAFWQQVRDTCASIAGKQPKKYSAEALTKWYNSLHTDSAEYKMWGNGIALPCAAFELAGVAFVLAGGHMHGAEKNQESSYRALAAVEK